MCVYLYNVLYSIYKPEILISLRISNLKISKNNYIPNKLVNIFVKVLFLSQTFNHVTNLLYYSITIG